MGSTLKLVRSPAVLMAIGVAATLVLALVVVTTLLRTGGAKAVSDNAALIGALVALGGVFTAQLVSIALDDRRSQEARRLEAQRASEAALQRYFKDVGELLIEKPLREASPGDNLSTVVRAQTLAVLEGLDHYRKRILLRFLHESGLIQKDKPVVSLLAANLHGAHLRGADLRGADLRGADLSLVNLNFANPRVADLNMVNQTLANPGGTARRVADLLVADLLVADLTGADLTEADLTGAKLTGADLSRTDLRGANLAEASLYWADLEGADLTGADLTGADLSMTIPPTWGAGLRWTYHLRGARERQAADAIVRAYMRGADERLAGAASLKGATMPNGQKYEDWLKSKDSGENE